MEFRILEIKESKFREKYKPQYKKSGWFSRWRNISETTFAESICCSVEFSSWDNRCVWTFSDAEKIIDEFKDYINGNDEYVIEHKIS